jgi:hypothetical protein
MQIICDGMQRSGSTWSYHVARGLLLRCRPGEEIHCSYLEDVAEFIASAPASARHTLLKTHLLDPTGKALARSGAARFIYTWRNLPDVTASFLAIFGGDFEHAFLAITNSLVIYRFHVRERNALLLGYDEIMHSPREAIARVAAYLGLEPAESDIAALAHEQSLPEVRRRLEQGETSHDPHAPETMLHPHHIQKGGSGYGAKILTPEQLARLEALRQEYGFF